MSSGLSPFDLIAGILLVAALIGSINHLFVRIPPSVGMLLGSLLVCIAVLGIDEWAGHGFLTQLRTILDQADLSHVFLDGTLAFLLFAGSLHVSLIELRDNKWTILVLATASVILATVLFGGGIWLVFRLTDTPVPLGWCAVLGAVLAPTDAVVVDGLLRRLQLPIPLRAAISGESLFNDGAGVILFLITLGIAQGQKGLVGHGQVAAALLAAGLGGAALGGGAGYLAGKLMARIDDAGLQLTISLALVMTSYRLAGALDVSGPIAVVTAGLLVGRITPQFAPHGDGPPSVVLGFWTLFDELLNAMLFLLIGFQIADLSYSRLAILPILMSVPLSVVSRLISIAIPVLVSRGSWRDRERAIAVMTWAGLRGGVSIALALTIPQTPYRAQLLTICYSVVLFTIIVQGMTMPGLIRRLYGKTSAGQLGSAGLSP
jgi:CPA1 family monovalent cation:H+ antiporter